MRVSKRQFLFGLGGAAALAFTGARAELECQPYEGGQVCTAGLRIPPGRVTAQQECEFWCWAACIEAIFALNGYGVSQAEIVERVYPDLACAPAVGEVIAQAASGLYLSSEGREFYAETEILLDANSGIWREDATLIAAEELRANRPLIVGAASHAVLLTALSYAQDSYGNYEILEAVVRDPWPTSPNRRVLTEAEAQQMFFLAAVQAV